MSFCRCQLCFAPLPVTTHLSFLFRFGYSQREYAVLHELSAEGTGGEELDVDMEEEEDIDREGAEERIKKEEEDYF